MVEFLSKILFFVIRMLIWETVSVAALSFAEWIDGKIPGRRMKIAVGMLFGLAAFFLVPAFAGLLSAIF